MRSPLYFQVTRVNFASKYVFAVAGLALSFALASPLSAQTAPTAATPAKPAANQTAPAAVAPAKPAVKKAPAAAAAPKVAPVPGIIWRGDRATERAFMADLAKDYEAAKLGKITMQPFSTISGIDAVHDGTADLAGSARPAIPGRVEESDLIFNPIAWEALVPITSPKNPVDNVTLKQLYDIYLGRITNWKDLGGPDEPIDLYGIAALHDGVEYSMRKLLYHKGDQAVSVPRLYLNTARLEEGIALDPRSLGFTTDSAVFANKGVKVLMVEGRAAAPSTIADGTYPLFSTLYLATRKEGKNSEAVDRFIQYTRSDAGKAVLRRHQLIPYDDAPALMTKLDEQIAYIDAHVNAPTPTPVSAPQATADYLVRTQPNSVEAQEAKERAARAAAEKAAKEKTGSQ